MLSCHQRPHGLNADVDGDREEARPDQPLRPALSRLRPFALSGETPQDNDSGCALDHAVRPEAHQRNRARGEPGEQGDRGLDQVPTEPQCGQKARSADEGSAVGNGRDRSDG
jgi:hypothetical protein